MLIPVRDVKFANFSTSSGIIEVLVIGWCRQFPEEATVGDDVPRSTLLCSTLRDEIVESEIPKVGQTTETIRPLPEPETFKRPKQMCSGRIISVFGCNWIPERPFESVHRAGCESLILGVWTASRIPSHVENLLPKSRYLHRLHRNILELVITVDNWKGTFFRATINFSHTFCVLVRKSKLFGISAQKVSKNTNEKCSFHNPRDRLSCPAIISKTTIFYSASLNRQPPSILLKVLSSNSSLLVLLFFVKFDEFQRLS